jgi:hypothetical protein
MYVCNGVETGRLCCDDDGDDVVSQGRSIAQSLARSLAGAHRSEGRKQATKNGGRKEKEQTSASPRLASPPRTKPSHPPPLPTTQDEKKNLKKTATLLPRLPRMKRPIQHLQRHPRAVQQPLAHTPTLRGINVVLGLVLVPVVVVRVAGAKHLPLDQRRRRDGVRLHAAVLHVRDELPVDGVVHGHEAADLVEGAARAALRHGVAAVGC